jgi:hypothetical protein
LVANIFSELSVGNIAQVFALMAMDAKTRKPVDKDRIERSTRAALLTIAAERMAREAKTSRLRELRLIRQAVTSKK